MRPLTSNLAQAEYEQRFSTRRGDSDALWCALVLVPRGGDASDRSTKRVARRDVLRRRAQGRAASSDTLAPALRVRRRRNRVAHNPIRGALGRISNSTTTWRGQRRESLGVRLSTRGALHGMGIGMATKKVTITLEETQLASIQELVKVGKSSSVSAFVQHAVTVSLADVSGWSAMLGIALRETGGPLTRKERDWADSLLESARKPKTKRKGKAA